jgi:hypothetical protein
MAWRRRDRRGRPRKATSRRRATTVAGRAPPPDFGSPELIRRKLVVANGSKTAVELVDVVGILAANELIVDEELVALRMVSEWLATLARGFHLPQASPAGLWRALQAQAGQTGGWWTSQLSGTRDVPGANRAQLRLSELFQHFAGLDQLEALRLIVRVAGNEVHPENVFELARLRYGTQLVMHLHRRGRQGRS